jgi:hypothetical protein
MNQEHGIHTPRHLLEMLAATGDPEHAPEARQHIASCQTCSSRFTNITRGRVAYLAAYPADDFARQVAARAERARRPAAAAPADGREPSRQRPMRRRWLAGVGAVALAMGAVALFALRPRGISEEIRLKGGATWSVFVKRGARTWPAQEGESLKTSDRLAFAYSLADDRYFLLFGVDDAGTTVQYGAEGAQLLLLRRGRGELPFGIELDARTGEERLFALFSRAPLDVATARVALAAAIARARAERRPVTGAELKTGAEILTFGFKKI